MLNHFHNDLIVSFVADILKLLIEIISWKEWISMPIYKQCTEIEITRNRRTNNNKTNDMYSQIS